MPHKTLFVPTDCEGALQSAIRVRIIYLQSWREQTLALARQSVDKKLANSYTRTADALMQDIAHLTMLGDNLAESKAN